MSWQGDTTRLIRKDKRFADRFVSACIEGKCISVDRTVPGVERDCLTHVSPVSGVELGHDCMEFKLDPKVRPDNVPINDDWESEPGLVRRSVEIAVARGAIEEAGPGGGRYETIYNFYQPNKQQKSIRVVVEIWKERPKK